MHVVAVLLTFTPQMQPSRTATSIPLGKETAYHE